MLEKLRVEEELTSREIVFLVLIVYLILAVSITLVLHAFGASLLVAVELGLGGPVIGVLFIWVLAWTVSPKSSLLQVGVSVESCKIEKMI